MNVLLSYFGRRETTTFIFFPDDSKTSWLKAALADIQSHLMFAIKKWEFEIVDYMFMDVKEKLALIYTKEPDKEKKEGILNKIKQIGELQVKDLYLI